MAKHITKKYTTDNKIMTNKRFFLFEMYKRPAGYKYTYGAKISKFDISNFPVMAILDF